jgi:phosphohistidine phosphatase
MQPDGASPLLLVVRHGKSAWPPGVDDLDRPLGPRGERAAEAVGRFLAASGLLPDQVVCSPARRARDTAGRLLAGAGFDGTAELPPVAIDERLYEGEAVGVVADRVADLLDSFLGDGGPDGRRLLVVGHEPELEALVGRVTGGDVRLPTAALAVMELDPARLHRLTVDEPLGPCGRLLLLLPPRLLSVAR